MKKLLSLTLIAGTTIMVHGQTINTAAGNGRQGFSGDGGQATLAELNTPIAVAADSAGNLYIADYDNQRIRLVNTSGFISTFAGIGTAGYSGDGGPASVAELHNPFGLAFDHNGNLLVADEDNYRIRKISKTDTITTVAGNGIASYFGDGGPATNAEIALGWEVATDSKGNFYISDLGAERLRIVNTAGIINTIAGNGTYGYSGDGGQATNAELGGLSAASVDAKGNIYLACQNNEAVRMVDTAGIINTIAGNGTAGFSGDGGTATLAELNGVFSVVPDNFGNLYLGDQNNERIRFINSSGIISTFAGNGSASFSGDSGPATSAELNDPDELVLAPGGLVYIADQQNHRIRVVSGITTAINDLKTLSEITVYPNPSTGIFTLQLSVVSRQSSVEIYNVFGQLIYTQYSIPNTQYMIDLKNEPDGIYFYKVRDGKGDLLGEGKMVKER